MHLFIPLECSCPSRQSLRGEKALQNGLGQIECLSGEPPQGGRSRHQLLKYGGNLDRGKRPALIRSFTGPRFVQGFLLSPAQEAAPTSARKEYSTDNLGRSSAGLRREVRPSRSPSQGTPTHAMGRVPGLALEQSVCDQEPGRAPNFWLGGAGREAHGDRQERESLSSSMDSVAWRLSEAQ